jgi:hypothetical protein
LSASTLVEARCMRVLQVGTWDAGPTDGGSRNYGNP